MGKRSGYCSAANNVKSPHSGDQISGFAPVVSSKDRWDRGGHYESGVGFWVRLFDEKGGGDVGMWWWKIRGCSRWIGKGSVQG